MRQFFYRRFEEKNEFLERTKGYWDQSRKWCGQHSSSLDIQYLFLWAYLRPLLKIVLMKLGIGILLPKDQVEIKLQNFSAFKICKILAPKIIRVLKKIISEQFNLKTIIGYRVGKSKGALNLAGLRTQFSNHSFGEAIDFNSEQNGLYDFCPHFGPHCRLIKGGAYIPDRPEAITKNSVLYKAMILENFKWGGEIQGNQKDFMHFSINGM